MTSHVSISMLRALCCLALLVQPQAALGRDSSRQSGVTVEDYDATLDLTRPLRLLGSLTIRLRLAPSAASVLVLDAEGLTVDAVRLGSRALRFHGDGRHLRVFLPVGLPRGRALKLSIRYHGEVARALARRGPQLVAMFHTRRWLVSLDQPAMRASLTLRVRVVAPLQVIAVGRRLGRRKLTDGTLLYAYRLDRAHSPYLFGFAVGRFRRLSLWRAGRSYTLWSASHDDRQLRRVAEMLPAMTTFFERHAGTPLPGRRFELVIVAGRAAQELAGMAFVSERYIDAVLRDPREDWLLAHELAHQWWGNRVTNQSWSHLWLHEGLVTFMVAAFKEQRWGRAAYEREIGLFRKRYRRLRTAGRDRPLVHDNWTRSDQMGGPLPYCKGALVFVDLRRLLGDPLFWRGIRRFTRRFFDKLVRSDDLRLALERVGSRSLLAFFRERVGAPALLAR